MGPSVKADVAGWLVYAFVGVCLAFVAGPWFLLPVVLFIAAEIYEWVVFR